MEFSTEPIAPETKQLIYVADPMCSWCYGFAPVIAAIADAFRERLPISLLLGGLRAGNTRPMTQTDRDIGYQMITEMGENREGLEKLRDFFVHNQDHYKAAQVCEKLDLLDEAAEHYARAEEPFFAAELYMRVGDEANAAKMYEASGQYGYAAEVYVRLERLEEAAHNYELAGDHLQARGGVWTIPHQPEASPRGGREMAGLSPAWGRMAGQST